MMHARAPSHSFWLPHSSSDPDTNPWAIPQARLMWTLARLLWEAWNGALHRTEAVDAPSRQDASPFREIAFDRAIPNSKSPAPDALMG